MAVRTKTQRALVVFPAIAMVVSLGCVSASQAQNNNAPTAKKTTTTLKRKTTSTTKAPKGTGVQSALTVLGAIKIEKERPQGYKRDLFKHWTDDDGDSCNTREEVLIAESRTPAQVDAYGCKVVAGDWFSDYDGVLHTDPSDLDIDHFVPLKEAWDSGAWAWSPSQRQRFANDLSDPRALIAELGCGEVQVETVHGPKRVGPGQEHPHQQLPVGNYCSLGNRSGCPIIASARRLCCA
jgi:hypothetical protein